MLYGISNLSICSTDLDATNSLRGFNIFKDVCLGSFSLTGDANEVLARCFKRGRLQIAASQVNQEDYQLDISMELSDWSTLQFAYGELSSSAPISLPQNTFYQVPATGGLTITNTDISTANANGATVKVYDETLQLFLAPGTVTPGANEFVVDESDGTITLNASQQSSAIFYTYEKVYTSADQIGCDTNDLTREFSMTGILSSSLYGVEGIGIYIPKVQPISIPTIDLSGDRAVIEVSYRPIITPGFSRPFKLIRLDTAVEA